MICTSLQNKDFEQLLALLDDPAIEMAEIRLDRCPLTDEQIQTLFSESDLPLIATCRIAESPSEQEAEHRLRVAIEAGARFADLEIEAPAPMSKRFQHLCRKNGTEIIRSWHDFEQTPDAAGLQRILARCFRYGADIAKIVTTCRDEEDAACAVGFADELLGLLPGARQDVADQSGALIVAEDFNGGLSDREGCESGGEDGRDVVAAECKIVCFGFFHDADRGLSCDRVHAKEAFGDLPDAVDKAHMVTPFSIMVIRLGMKRSMLYSQASLLSMSVEPSSRRTHAPGSLSSQTASDQAVTRLSQSAST